MSVKVLVRTAVLSQIRVCVVCVCSDVFGAFKLRLWSVFVRLMALGTTLTEEPHLGGPVPLNGPVSLSLHVPCDLQKNDN